ncbi:MAG TPA: hypothetical protein VGC17_01265 [Lactovum miscens]|uniref:hypothetical protein n=1 Tax=Lactovum miscens TaxID=190387 RepID=UPI002ED86A2F
MISEELYKYVQFRGRTKDDKYLGLYGKASSVSPVENTRFSKAKEQADQNIMKKVDIDNIIQFTKEFFELIGMPDVESLQININIDDILKNQNVRIDYNSLKTDYKLNNVKHLIWMKFTDDNYLGVVAASNDVNFSMSNTAGRILNSLDKKWNKSFVLVFPLSHISDGLRKDIECGLGNYLSENQVPILDYYSHRFQ